MGINVNSNPKSFEDLEEVMEEVCEDTSVDSVESENE